MKSPSLLSRRDGLFAFVAQPRGAFDSDWRSEGAGKRAGSESSLAVRRLHYAGVMQRLASLHARRLAQRLTLLVGATTALVAACDDGPKPGEADAQALGLPGSGGAEGGAAGSPSGGGASVGVGGISAAGGPTIGGKGGTGGSLGVGGSAASGGTAGGGEAGTGGVGGAAQAGTGGSGSKAAQCAGKDGSAPNGWSSTERSPSFGCYCNGIGCCSSHYQCFTPEMLAGRLKSGGSAGSAGGMASDLCPAPHLFKEGGFEPCTGQQPVGMLPPQGDLCCYTFSPGSCCGRPLLDGGEARIAPLVANVWA